MSQLKTNSITNIGNTGDANVVLGADGDTQVQSLNSGPLAGFRNQIINGDFRVWQRGISFNIPSGGFSEYTADRWKQGVKAGVGASGSISNGTKPSIAPVAYFITDGGSLQQGVELPLNGSSQGRCGPFTIGSQWTLSVWSNKDLTVTAPIFRFRDQVSQSTNQVDASSSIPNWQQISTVADNGFHHYAVTITIDASPVDSNKCLNFSLPSAIEVGGGLAYALAQLEPGPVATPFEQRPYGTELALCLRYYFDGALDSFGGSANTVTSPVFRHAAVASSGWYAGTIIYPQPMRVPPTVSFKTLNYRNCSNLVTNNTISIIGTSLTVTTSTSTNYSVSGGVIADAEL